MSTPAYDAALAALPPRSKTTSADRATVAACHGDGQCAGFGDVA
jgi:hypothetical protein